MLVGLQGLFIVRPRRAGGRRAARPGGSPWGSRRDCSSSSLGTGLLFCAWGLFRVGSWARGPVLAVELIGVLLSFSFWGGETTRIAVVILLVSLAVLVGVLHPASTRALAADEG